MDTNRIYVKSLVITEFRKFNNCQIDFNKPITLITGQNGTAKSTLLGMLAQPFSFGSKQDKQDESAYTKNYNGLKLSEYTDIAGNNYTYPCDKIFRLSKKHDTPQKKYLYETVLKGLDFEKDSSSPLKTKKLLTVKQPRFDKLRFVTGPANKDSESISHNSGEGNFPHPVIYLSLGRLYPLAELKSCQVVENDNALSKDESEWFVKSYKEIFAVVDENPESGLMDTKEKKTSIVPLTSFYDGESCSAGQDNVSRILTAILSYRRLKNQLAEKYRGGLLLIDEVDSTLHPASQIRLMDLICRETEDLSLQVVLTTHSLYLVQYCYRKLQMFIGIIHIRKQPNALTINSKATPEDIEADLENKFVPPPKRIAGQKVSVVLEDGEAVKLFRYLVKHNEFLKNKIKIANIKGKKNPDKATHISGQYLKIFAENADKIPELEKVVFIPDGDMEWAKKTAKNKNTVALPGNECIEKQIFKMLKNLPSEDSFWAGCEGSNYSKQTAIGNYFSVDESCTDDVKKWYKEQKQAWGKNQSIVFSKYFELHKKECLEFLSKLQNIIKQCLQ